MVKPLLFTVDLVNFLFIECTQPPDKSTPELPPPVALRLFGGLSLLRECHDRPVQAVVGAHRLDDQLVPSHSALLPELAQQPQPLLRGPRGEHVLLPFPRHPLPPLAASLSG